MPAKILLLALAALILLNTQPAAAQQPKKVPRIGYLSTSTNPARTEAFRQGLRELGYVEGKNISIEYRALAADLVRLKVDVIVTPGATSTRAAKAATSTIPIVMAQDPDPIGNGFVASLARPGGNITGLSGVLNSLRAQVVELAAKSRLPAIYWAREFVEAGGLMSYGVSVTDLDRRAATYVDKILKGAKPADIPVEQPTKFEFIINLKAAKQIGLTIPPNVLVRADRVIR